MNQASLDSVFFALADPTRRGMLAQLSDGQANITSLAQQYSISQPAISKHLGVLERAGLIRRRKQGRQYLISVDPRPIAYANNWIQRYARFWEDQFDAVEQRLQQLGQLTSNPKISNEHND